VTEIEAVVVEISPQPIGGPGLGRWYGLRIETIDGKNVDRPPTVRFEVEGSLMVRLAPHDEALARLFARLIEPGQFAATISPAEVGSAAPLSPSEVSSLRSNYIGSRHRLIVYETGRLYGSPDRLPNEFGWLFGPGPSFHFASHIVVLAEKRPNKAPEPRPWLSRLVLRAARVAPAMVVARLER
jgi:hypothetical protein